MKVLAIEQNSEAWLDFRRGKIGGSKAKGIKPLKTGKFKGQVSGSAGFWDLLAERVSIAKDGESDMDRGHRLEPLGNKLTNDKYKLNLCWKTEEDLIGCGIWVSDDKEDMYISPDSAEKGDKPTYANETKAFGTAKHLRIMYEDMQAKKKEDYNSLNSLPVDNQDQAIDYFVINKDMKTLYWTLINDMVAFKNLEHYVIVIKREDVQNRIDDLETIQHTTLNQLDAMLENIENWGN